MNSNIKIDKTRVSKVEKFTSKNLVTAHSLELMADLQKNDFSEGVEEGLKPHPSIPTPSQSGIKITDYMRKGLERVALSEGFENYELKVDQGSVVGDGFVGVIYKVTIQEIESGKKLDVVMKFPPASQERRNDFGAMDLFEREVFVYNEVFPEFVKFQQEKKIKESEGFFDFPKCYFAEFNVEEDDSIIIMEDLRENGYKMLNKHVPINYKHTKLLIEALGKLHAVSFAMKNQKPEIFAKFKLMKDFVFEKLGAANLTTLMTGSIEKAAETINESDLESRNKVLKLKNEYEKITQELINPDLAEPYAVVGQGDCWTNNLMYQYKASI